MNINIKNKKGKHLNYQDKLKIEGFLGNRNILGYDENYVSKKVIKSTKRKYRKLVNELAEYMGKSKRTIKRELDRGKVQLEDYLSNIYYAYSADISHKRYKQIRNNDTRPLKIDNNLELYKYIAKLLKMNYSPYACIQLAIKDGFEPNISPRTLLNYIRIGLFESVGIKSNFSIYKRKKKNKSKYSKMIRKGKYNSIEDRTDDINNRENIGHWEVDTVVGTLTGKNQVLLVLTERYSRYQIIKKIKRKKVKYVLKAIKNIIKTRKDLTFLSFTSDNGVEFNGTDKLCSFSKVIWYYCHPYCSGERGTNENNNKFIRRFIPKGTKFEKYTNSYIQEIEDYINNYPRLIFNGSTSKEIYFNKKLAV